MGVAVVLHLLTLIGPEDNQSAQPLTTPRLLGVLTGVSECQRHSVVLCQNCRAGLPSWFHLICDHRLCSPVIIRKYLSQTLWARNPSIMVKEKHPGYVKTAALKKNNVTFEKCYRACALLTASCSFSQPQTSNPASPQPLLHATNKFHQKLSTAKPSNILCATYFKPYENKLPQQPES